MPLRMRVHEREPIGLALRRFKKLLERSGIQKELRKRKYYEKPCEARRRAELRKQSAIRKARTAAAQALTAARRPLVPESECPGAVVRGHRNPPLFGESARLMRPRSVPSVR